MLSLLYGILRRKMGQQLYDLPAGGGHIAPWIRTRLLHTHRRIAGGSKFYAAGFGESPGYEQAHYPLGDASRREPCYPAISEHTHHATRNEACLVKLLPR